MTAAPAKIELPSEEKEILESVSQLGDKAKVAFSKPGRIKLTASREDLLEVARYVRDTLHFDHCANVSGTDFPKEAQLEITYHFGALDTPGYRRIILALACRVPAADPV